jgi:hypothetical protein
LSVAASIPAVLVALLLAGVMTVFAQIPRTVGHQGLLTLPGGAAAPDGNYTMTFRIYNLESGGTALWTETQTLAVSGGVYSATLGSVTALNLSFDVQYWLGVQLSGEPEMAPRVRLTSTPYAYRAVVAEGLAGGTAGDITAVYANDGLIGGATSGDASLSVGAGTGIQVSADAVALASPYIDGSAYDGRFVNEGQGNSVTADMVTPNIVGALDGVMNDGGNIDLIAGPNITITPDDANNQITISASGGGGGIGGSGVANWVPRFIDSTTLGTSTIWDNGTRTDITTDDYESGWPILGVGYLGFDLQDVIAVKGFSTPQDFYGIGGQFRGGYIGADVTVMPSGGSTYFALRAIADGGSGSNYGVYASAVGSGSKYGLYATAGGAGSSYAGYFEGNVHVNGNHTVIGTKSFRIDHPLDPANEYLNHFAVESDEVLNAYRGNVVLDQSGEAWVKLADWYDAVNRDPSYQLTCVGGQAAVYIAEKINDGRFKIAGGTPGLTVSWLVMAVRNDPTVRKLAPPVEQEKPAAERGKYLDPESYGMPASLQIGLPEQKKAE